MPLSSDYLTFSEPPCRGSPGRTSDRLGDPLPGSIDRRATTVSSQSPCIAAGPQSTIWRTVTSASYHFMVRLRPQPLKALNDDAQPAARTPPRSGLVHGALSRRLLSITKSPALYMWAPCRHVPLPCKCPQPRTTVDSNSYSVYRTEMEPCEKRHASRWKLTWNTSSDLVLGMASL